MMNATSDGRFIRGEQRKTRVLDAAVRVVAGRGCGALTHRAAAAGAGVSVASVTYHFPLIEDLRQAMFEHAGSRVGLAFRAIIEASASGTDDVPEICATFAASLVTERRVDTSAVLEMIVAAGHDPSLRPLVTFFNDRLGELLTPYTGDRFQALTVAAAIQGLILGHLAQSDADTARGLHDSVVDLVRRYRGARDADTPALRSEPS
jgi:DNA-binding transcriptional regulator YbjK